MQYDLTKNTSTRSLLLVLENIKNNAELDTKLPSTTKMKGLMESARWSQQTPTSPRNPRRWAGPTSITCYARSTVGHTRATTCMTGAILTKTVLLSKRMRVQISLIQKKGEAKAYTLCRVLHRVEQSIPQALKQAQKMSR
jgi:hypothetical protein